MEILIYALIALFIIALIAGSIRQWWYHRKGEEVPDIQEPRPDGCCGQHEVRKRTTNTTTNIMTTRNLTPIADAPPTNTPTRKWSNFKKCSTP